MQPFYDLLAPFAPNWKYLSACLASLRRWDFVPNFVWTQETRLQLSHAIPPHSHLEVSVDYHVKPMSPQILSLLPPGLFFWQVYGKLIRVGDALPYALVPLQFDAVAVLRVFSAKSKL
jgi:hypothetical protein